MAYARQAHKIHLGKCHLIPQESSIWKERHFGNKSKIKIPFSDFESTPVKFTPSSQRHIVVWKMLEVSVNHMKIQETAKVH